MTLLELLVKELPKRGGWPEGAGSVSQSRIDGQLYFYAGKCNRTGADLKSDYRLNLCDECYFGAPGLPSVTREQYEAALKPAWNGEGLPPVGTECEVIEEKPLSVFDKWTPCKVIHFNCRDEKETQVCIIDNNGDFAILYSNDAFKFRPIRTEAERKRDEFANACIEIDRKGDYSNSHAFFCGVYDAIAAVKIPGVELSK